MDLPVGIFSQQGSTPAFSQPLGTVKTLQAGCSHAEGFASAFPAQQDEQSRLGREDLVAGKLHGQVVIATSPRRKCLEIIELKKPETRVRFGKVASCPFGHMKFDQKRPTNYWNLRRYRF